jgi:hypothetical protein
MLVSPLLSWNPNPDPSEPELDLFPDPGPYRKGFGIPELADAEAAD